MALHHHQGVAQIHRMVGAETEFPARLQLGRDQLNRAVVHHAALGMARLGPGIGVQQIGKGQRIVRDTTQNLQSIAMVDAHVGDRRMGRFTVRQAATRNMDQRRRHRSGKARSR
jgi:hypothetical protein